MSQFPTYVTCSFINTSVQGYMMLNRYQRYHLRNQNWMSVCLLIHAVIYVFNSCHKSVVPRYYGVHLQDWRSSHCWWRVWRYMEMYLWTLWGTDQRQFAISFYRLRELTVQQVAVKALRVYATDTSEMMKKKSRASILMTVQCID